MPEPSRSRTELRRLIDEIRRVNVELEQLEDGGKAEAVRARRRELEQLRRRLAVVARRFARSDLGAAA